MENKQENRVVTKYLSLNKTQPMKKHQLLLEGDIIVPDVKPDIRNVLEYDYDVFIDQTDVLNNKCVFKGALEVKILYIAKGSEYIHSMVNRVNIDDYLSLTDVTENVYYDVKCEITNIDFKMLNDRKISYRCVIDVVATGVEKGEYEYISNVEGVNESDVLLKELLVLNNVGHSKDKFIVKEQIDVSQNSENIYEVVQMRNRLQNRDVQCLDGEVLVSAELLSTIFYRQDRDGSVLECIEHTTPFSGTIALKESKEGVGMTADVEMFVCDSKVIIGLDEDGEERCFDIDVDILAKVRCLHEDRIKVVEDVHCINKKSIFTTKNIETTNIISKNKNQCNIKDVIEIVNIEDDILQVISVNPKAFVTKVQLDDGKVVVEGFIELSTVYIVGTDDNPICSSKNKIPFNQVVEVKGALAYMNCDLDVFIENIGFNMLNDKAIEVRIILNINTTISEIRVANIYSDLFFEDIDQEILNSIPSITLYVVQKGDTLWNIAKEYNTSVDEIVNINNIEDVDNISIGDKLLIIKKVKL